MSKIIDRRSFSMGGSAKRAVSRISQIAIHYSATKVGNTTSFENYWKNSRGWNTGGYHEVVLLNGDVELNYNPNVVSNGVYGHNTITYNICYVGDSQPNTAQRKALIERLAYNKKRLGVANSNIKGHREFSGQSTSCPAVNVATLVKEADGKVTVKPPVIKPEPKKKPQTGNTGDPMIRKIQTQLNRYWSIDIAVDGLNGPATKRSLVHAYQQELNSQFNAGLVLDGLPGRRTDNAAVTIRQNNSYGDIAFLTQAMLYLHGININVDGYFGAKSVAATKTFQRNNGLKPDGIPGKGTFKKLIRL